MKNGWLAFSLLAAACAGAAVRPVIFPAANANAEPAAEHCDWRALTDNGSPEIPESLKNTPMGEEWTALGKAGYRLVHSEGAFYVFERCVPAK
jgi:hypothetical protein